LTIPSGSVTGVTYGGVAMTLIRAETPSTIATIGWSIWGLANPSTGSNTVSVTLNTQNYNVCSGYAYSFTGSSGAGNTGFDGASVTGNTCSLTISANSMIIAMGFSGVSTGAYIEIPDGTIRTLKYTHNINNYTWGAISPSLSSGSVTVQAGVTGSPNNVFAVEIKEAVSATIPTVTLEAVVLESSTSARGYGTVVSDGGSSVTSRGFSWYLAGIQGAPINFTVDEATGTGIYDTLMTGLTPGVKYYVNAFAVNSIGTVYSTTQLTVGGRRIIIT